MTLGSFSLPLISELFYSHFPSRPKEIFTPSALNLAPQWALNDSLLTQNVWGPFLYSLMSKDFITQTTILHYHQDGKHCALQANKERTLITVMIYMGTILIAENGCHWVGKAKALGNRDVFPIGHSGQLFQGPWIIGSPTSPTLLHNNHLAGLLFWSTTADPSAQFCQKGGPLVLWWSFLRKHNSDSGACLPVNRPAEIILIDNIENSWVIKSEIQVILQNSNGVWKLIIISDSQ